MGSLATIAKEHPVTVVWTEFAIHVEAAFGAGPATRDRLLAYATGSHARPELIAALRSLPDRPYAGIDDLWQELAHGVGTLRPIRPGVARRNDGPLT